MKSEIIAAYDAVVDHSLSLDEMVAQANFTNVHLATCIFPEVISDTQETVHVEILQLYLVQQNIQNEEILPEIDRLGYRPATLRELLAVAAVSETWGNYIVALGTESDPFPGFEWYDKEPRIWVGLIGNLGDGRHKKFLTMYDTGYWWGACSATFAVVKKKEG